VLIVALDGLEWQVILPLARAGRMPHLVSLMERGTFGTLKTLAPTLSPRLWTSLATGKTPKKHGILGFIKPREGRGPAKLYTRMDRKVKAYWNILADEGMATTTIGWWMTYPPEQIPGLMVSQTNAAYKRGGLRKGALRSDTVNQVWPPDQEAGVLATLAAHHASLSELTDDIFGTFDPPLDGEPARRWEQCQWAFRADSTYAQVLEDRLAQPGDFPPSLVTAIYMGGTDVVGHRFWAAQEPEPFGLAPDSEEVRRFAHVIPSYYVYVDTLLGRLLDLFPPGTTVFVLSDHGMSRLLPKVGPDPDSGEPVSTGVLPARGKTRVAEHTGGHEGDPGAFIAAGAGIRRLSEFVLDDLDPESMPELGSILDFCPTLLALLEIPVGKDMDGKPMRSVLIAELFADGPPRRIITHDDPEWLAGQDANFERVDEERLEQLRNLGYLGDDDD
jgi:arylsulfatase A-like enzyme